jgi:hypothetical protein
MNKEQKWWLFRHVILILNSRDNPEKLQKELDAIVPFVKQHRVKYRMLQLKEKGNEGQGNI